jgi:hypothetical protein
MTWIVAGIRWIMLVSGVLTSTMFYAALAPEAALRSTFGEALQGPLAEIVVRNWGALIGLVGAMLIYGAYSPAARPLVLTIAGLSKLVFIGLVLSQGERYLGSAGLPVVIDLVCVVLYGAYLLAVGGRAVDDACRANRGCSEAAGHDRMRSGEEDAPSRDSA